MDVESHKLFLAKGSQRTPLSDASIQPRVHAAAAQRVESCHFLQKIKFPVAYYYYYYLWPRYWIPREWKHYAMQYKKVQKSSWNEPYSSSSFTKQSCSKMALHRWIRTESRWNKKLISLSSPDWSASLHMPQFKYLYDYSLDRNAMGSRSWRSCIITAAFNPFSPTEKEAPTGIFKPNWHNLTTGIQSTPCCRFQTPTTKTTKILFVCESVIFC